MKILRPALLAVALMTLPGLEIATADDKWERKNERRHEERNRGEWRARDRHVVVPRDKNACKDDGWRRYGFKNQGQCVSAVNRAARDHR